MDWENIYCITLTTTLNILDSQYVTAYKILQKITSVRCERAWEIIFDICEIIQNRSWSNMWVVCLRARTRQG